MFGDHFENDIYTLPYPQFRNSLSLFFFTSLVQKWIIMPIFKHDFTHIPFLPSPLQHFPSELLSADLSFPSDHLGLVHSLHCENLSLSPSEPIQPVLLHIFFKYGLDEITSHLVINKTYTDQFRYIKH